MSDVWFTLKAGDRNICKCGQDCSRIDGSHDVHMLYDDHAPIVIDKEDREALHDALDNAIDNVISQLRGG